MRSFMEQIKISYSRASSYLRCPYAHYLSYVRRLMLNKPIRPLQFGGSFHKLLEFRNDHEKLEAELARIEDEYYAMPSNWQTDLGEDYLSDLRIIFEDYNKVYANDITPDVPEQRFDIPIGKYKGVPVLFTGVIDEVYFNYDGSGDTVVGEHKTFSRRPDLNTLVMNTQKCLYAKAVEKLHGVRPKRILWNYICSAPAEQPVWLEKSGRFSQAKSQKITPYSYLRACEAKGIEPDADTLKGYEDNIPNFFFRYPLDLPPSMVDDVFDGFVYTCKMIAKYGEKNKVKNLTRDCSWCSFRDICYTEMTGGDVEYTIEKNYTVKPVEEETATAEEAE